MNTMSSIKNWIKRYPAIRKLAGKLVATVPLSYRLGEDFWRWYSFFQESEGWSVEQIAEYQTERLRELVTTLKASSPFYAETLAEIDPKQIQSPDDFTKAAPLLSRSEFSRHFERIRTNRPGEKLLEGTTSGTTGNALHFFRTGEDDRREWAAICHQWSRVGYVPGRSRRAEFRGLCRNGQLVDYLPEKNAIRFSILHLKQDHVRLYADIVRDNRIDFFHGYPSALHLLATTIENEQIDFPQPKGILLASEQLHDWQVETIGRVFPNSKLYAHYGCAERTVLAGWCENRREYHVLPQYSLVEIDPRSCEVIGTNLFNTANGFLRYRMSDLVVESSWETCPDCQRPYTPRLLSIGGRSEDYLFSREKGWIPPAVITYPLKGLGTVEEIQFTQSTPDAIEVRYSIRSHSDKAAADNEIGEIKDDLVRLFGNSTRFEFFVVDGFERGSSGKFKWIINNLEEAKALAGDNE